MTIKRCYPVLVGASVTENQLFDPTKNIGLLGLTITQPEAGRFVVNGTIESNTSGNVNIELKKNRVYYFTSGRSQADIVLSNTANWVMSKAQYVIKPTGDGTFKPNVYVAAGTYTDANFIPQIIDLTAYFGSSIADYIYNLETATAGAGVAKLREWGFLTGEYIPHNAGSLESVEATAHKMVGFNQFDASNITPNSTINSSGNVIAGLYNVSDYIKILPNTTYFAHSVIKGNEGRSFCVYDENKTFITALNPEYPEGTVDYNVNNAFFTMPNNARYARIITATPNTCCINLSSSRNGEYEPYVSHTYDLGNDTLRGIFKLDANNNLYADGDRKESDGTVTRRYGVVTLDGSESGWGMSGYTSNNTYIISIPDVAVYADVNSISNIVSSGMPAISFADGYNNNNIFGIAVGNSAHELRVNVPISVINRDITAFKTWLTSNPLTVVYEKTTSTTETSTPFTSPQICYPDGTEEFVTENDVPVGHETKYQL